MRPKTVATLSLVQVTSVVTKAEDTAEKVKTWIEIIEVTAQNS